MPRRPRVTPGGFAYHVLNRTVAGLPLFRKKADYEAFERIMIEARGRHPLRILAWCLMRNHWHFVVWPREDGEVTAFFRWLAHTHAMRWHVAHNTVGRGHLYQGRFKSFPIQEDEHFFTACRYVERNALKAGVVERAEDWRWGSLWARHHGNEQLQGIFSDWPVECPRNWMAWVNQPMTEEEAERFQICMARNRPYGEEAWQNRQARRLGLLHTLRGEGRPKAIAPKN
jgi:putative transposase